MEMPASDKHSHLYKSLFISKVRNEGNIVYGSNIVLLCLS